MQTIEKNIAISFPVFLAMSLKMKEIEFEREMKTVSLVKLYEMGKVSSGIAAQILNISRLDFLNLLSNYNISYLSQSNNELEADYENA